MNDPELLVIVALVACFMAMCVISLMLQNKLTRAESTLRAIKWDLQTALDQIGPLSADDAEALALIQQYAADDARGQLFP